MNSVISGTEAFKVARGDLDVPGQRLEACEVVEGAWRFLLLVYRVEYGGGPLSETPPRIVRFSEGVHSILVAPRLLLSSPRYYRELEEKSAASVVQPKAQARRRGVSPKGEMAHGRIGDRMEARFQRN